jgi:type I restriction enzyme S subunit
MSSGWRTASFEDCVGKVTYTTKILRKDFLEDGPWPVVSQEDGLINGYWDNEADLFKVSTPVVVFGDHTRALKYVDFDFVLGADGVKILLPREFLVPKFFFYQLQGASLKSLGYARHYKLLNELEIGYPSKSEQQRIVRILDDAFAAVATARANAEQNLRSAREVFESQLQIVFSRRRPDWTDRELSEICEVFADGDWIESKDQSPKGIRLIQTGNVGVGVFKSRGEKARHISQGTFGRLHCTEIFEGDCLISRLPDPVGRSCLLPDTGERMITAVDCTIARFKPQVALPQYFNSYSQSPAYLKAVDSETTGTTRKRISRSSLGQIAVPIPPIEEQRRISAAVEDLSAGTERLASIYERKLAALDALKQSLLHQAFTGAL